ncbi:MAG: adenosylmethionine-8-amino-7-oxononanoate aminotransferase [Pirellulaceae bacterium]|nr:adenosylmethionine-8-amino-7-oxononanoate aminotransferase [Pirellulaceae bacterium]
MSETIKGKIIEVTSSGDLVTDIGTVQLSKVPRDETARIIVDDEHETFGLFPADHDQPAMTLIAIAALDSPLRLCLVGDSASMMLGVGLGASVQVKW